MVIFLLWVFFLSWLSLAEITGSAQSECHIDLIDVIAGETFIIGRWSLNNATLSITVKSGDNIRFSFAFNGEDHRSLQDEKGRLQLKLNIITREVSLVFDKVRREDEGQYTIQESFKRVKTDKYGREDGEWKFQLNVIDKPTHARIGDNVVICWFYNQHGINCKIRVIHPYEGVMMLVPSTNVPGIKSNFQHRFLYNGDVSEHYMSFTLLNVTPSDSGFYRIETLHEITIPGSKQLIVEANITRNGRNNETIGTSSTDVPLHHASSDIHESQKVTSAAISEIWSELDTFTERTHASESGSWSVPVYVIPIIIGVVGLINLMVCCQIWIHLKKIHGPKAERRLSLEECDTDLYLTPIKVERDSPIPTSEDGGTNYSYATENVQFDSSMQLLHETQSFCMNEYEIVDVPGNKDPPHSSHDETIIYESPETIKTPFHDTSGYLTVLAVMETSL